jgi:hypothetical protein
MNEQRGIIVVNPKADGLHTGNKWVRIPDGTKVRFREDGREGIIDGLTELVVGPGRNPDSRTQYRINIGDPDRTLAIEDDLLVLTDADGVVLMVKQKGEYRRVVTQQLQAVFDADRFVKAA